MRGGVFGEDAFAGVQAHAGAIFFGHRTNDLGYFVSILRQQNLGVRSEKVLQTLPVVGDDCSAAGRGFKKADRW